jgi:eukaryotic-like serine/threonine-protein kinase
MNTDRWHRIQRLFAEALAVAVAERASWLQQACGDDAELLHEVQALLAHDAASQRTLEQVVRSEADAVLAQVKVQRQGERFGPWEIVEHIADGGMGAVYRARRADGAFEQVAALKLLSPALLGEQGRRRLEVERQILAGLNHPHIARLLDGGSSAEGVPYLVMEYVDGVPIDDYCNTQGLDTPARLRLFLRVCEAVDYAHRNLVVHRDLKPSNLLVTADGTPKLLDFGISKLLDAADPALTAADQRLFTPAHASPEQVSGGPITTATDVYALGVLLYELLAGSLPFAAAGRTSAQIAQDILQTEPARPSVSVARTADSSERLAAARRRGDGLTAERLRRELDGDLDNIVLMALRKEPVRRYASVQALAEDVRAMLEHRPVKARADTLAYRTAKFLRRHRVGVALAASALLTIASMVSFYTWRIAEERDLAAAAQREAEAAAAVSDQTARFLAQLFDDADPLRSGRSDTTARQLLDQGRARLDQSTLPPQVRARLLLSMGGAYRSMSLYAEARAMLERSETLWRELHPGGSRDLTLVQLELGVTQLTQGENEAAIAMLEKVFAALDPQGTEPRDRARALRALAVALHDSRSDRPRALRLMEEAVAITARLGEPAAVAHVIHLSELGDMLAVPGSYDRSLATLDEAVALSLKVHGERHPATVNSLQKRASTLTWMGRYEEALTELDRAISLGRQALGAEHVRIGYMLSRMGNILEGLGRFSEAEARMREALAIIRLRLGNDNPRTVFMLENLAATVLAQDRTDEALAMYRESLQKVRTRFGEQHPETLTTLGNLAGAYLHAGRHRDALQALDAVAAARPADATPPVQDLIRRAQALIGVRQFDRADTVLEQAATIAEEKLPQHHDRKADILALQSRLLRKQGRLADGERRMAEAVAMMAAVQPADSPRLASLRSEWGELLLQTGRADEGQPLIKDSAALLLRALGPAHRDTRDAQRRLGLIATRRATG